MATANASASAAAAAAAAVMEPPAVAEDETAKQVHKRYEGLMTVRTKAIKGKGAWYWFHLEPILVQSSDTGLPKAVKLRCSLCDAVFSASNPSRTASEHLKRGTCPNFTSPSSSNPALPSPPPRPISSIAPCSSAVHPHHSGRKRSSAANPLPPSYHHHHASSLAIIDPSRFSTSPTAASAGGDVVYPSSTTPPPHHHHHHLVLSGGKEDLGALAMLEDSVKKLKSPKTSPGPALAKAQVDSALSLLSDWFYESCGAVSLSSAEHPKFRSFLHQVGLPPLSRRDLAGPRLDARFDEARADADARIRDALFFQLSSDGWRPRDATATSDALVSLAVNLPNGTSVFRRAVLSHDGAPSKYAEEVL